jgi:hypothetical protein
MEQADWWPASEVEARRLREEFYGDHERARKAINDCVGHHVVIFLPYDEWKARDVTDTTCCAGCESS